MLQLQLPVSMLLLVGLSLVVITTYVDTTLGQNIIEPTISNNKAYIDLIITQEGHIYKTIDFDPPEILINSGTTVVWTNKDTEIHSIKSVKPCPLFESYTCQNRIEYVPFDSGYLSPGESFEFTFDKPGHYEFVDTRSNLIGTIFVDN